MTNVQLFKQLIKLSGYDNASNALELLNGNRDMCIALVLDKNKKINGLKIVKADSKEPNIIKITDERDLFYKTQDQIEELIDAVKKVSSEKPSKKDIRNFDSIVQNLYYKAKIWMEKDAVKYLISSVKENEIVKKLTKEFNNKLTFLQNTIGKDFNLESFLQDQYNSFVTGYDENNSEGLWGNIKSFAAKNLKNVVNSKLMTVVQNKFPGLLGPIGVAVSLAPDIISVVNDLIPQKFKTDLYNKMMAGLNKVTSFFSNILPSKKENTVEKEITLTSKDKTQEKVNLGTKRKTMTVGYENNHKKKRRVKIIKKEEKFLLQNK